MTMACWVVLSGYSLSMRLISESGMPRHLASAIQSSESRLHMSDSRRSACYHHHHHHYHHHHHESRITNENWVETAEQWHHPALDGTTGPGGETRTSHTSVPLRHVTADNMEIVSKMKQ